jgi:hypothetical protein
MKGQRFRASLSQAIATGQEICLPLGQLSGMKSHAANPVAQHVPDDGAEQ